MRNMRITTLFEGHYRSLEDDFLELTTRILAEGRDLTVISAGTGQLDRLRSLLLENSDIGIAGGIEFLPGISHLARKISNVPTPNENVSHCDRTLYALQAMKDLKREEPLFDLRENAETAHSMGNFFEDLFEHGVNAELYEISSLSLAAGQSRTERTIGGILSRYEDERNRGYFSCGDMLLQRTIPADTRKTSIFYGYYDLNPSQRRFIRKYSKTSGEIYWFSPISEHSHWISIYLRTRQLLQDIGIDSIVRSGNNIQMNSFAGFFEALRKQPRPAVPIDGFRITAVSGEMGACRTVLKRIYELGKSVALNRIAVARRKQSGESLVRLAHHEGVPINAPLEVKLPDIPEGRFILDLMRAVNQDFYYVYLEGLLTSGLLKKDIAADPGEIADVVENSGIRMGLNRWRDWYSSGREQSRLVLFLRKLDTFWSGLPGRAEPWEYLGHLRKFFEETTSGSLCPAVADSLFDRDQLRFAGNVSWGQFTDSLKLYYQSKDIVLRDPDPEGFQMLTIEQLRGSLHESVLLMDVEEGIYPGSPGEDPRLSDDLRVRLQMTQRTEREIEDGFLLRQAGEAAYKTLDIIYREQDSMGCEIFPSPFISAMVLPQSGYSPDPAWFGRTSSSPCEQILAGTHPGQIRIRTLGESDFPAALRAEMCRMGYEGFNEYDGILDSSPVTRESFSPTFLEQYVRCPFAFLLERGWNIRRTEVTDISSTPDPLIRGSVVHEAVENIVEKSGLNPSRIQVEGEIRKAAVSLGIARKLGADYLQEIFVEKQTNSVVKSLRSLSSTGWKYLDSEKELEGCLGNLKINGKIDLIMEDDDSNLVLLDLKTGKPPGVKDIEKGKLFQLPFYYQLARDNYPGRSIASIAYVSISDRTPGKMSSLTGAEMEERMEGVRLNAERIVSMIRSGLFPPIPTSSCDYCAFRGLCRRNPFDRIKGKARSDDRMEFFREIMLKK